MALGDAADGSGKFGMSWASWVSALGLLWAPRRWSLRARRNVNVPAPANPQSWAGSGPLPLLVPRLVR